MIAPNPTSTYPIRKRPSRELIEKVRQEYAEGASLWVLANKYYLQISQSDLRRCLEGLIRPKGAPKTDPDEEEVVRRRDEIKSKWTAEQASRRWVGRFLSPRETAGEALSKALRAMGGNC